MSSNRDDLDMSEEDDKSRLVFSRGPYPLRHNRVFQCLVLVVALLAILCVVLIILLSIKKSDSYSPQVSKIVGTEREDTTSPPRAPTTKQIPTAAETTNATEGIEGKGNNNSTEFRCVDANIYCGYWTLIGECQKNPSYMLDKCCLWCSHLQDIKGQNCTDNHKNCVVWTNRGECWKNPAYMLDNCCRSCNDKGHSPDILKKEIGKQ